jgi:hypothetical protein
MRFSALSKLPQAWGRVRWERFLSSQYPLGAILLRIRCFSAGKPSGHLGPDGLQRTLLGHRLMHAALAGTLVFIQRYIPELHQPSRPAQRDHMNEQVAQRYIAPMWIRTSRQSG